MLKKLGKYSILLGIKESYLFSRNLLGLIFHPFKTLRAIQREKDYSQAFLIFGLPFYTFVFGVVFIVSARFLIHAPKDWGWIAKSLLALLALLALLIFIYLGYWAIKVRNLKFKVQNDR